MATKTPSRRRARSVTRNALTPSALVNGMNSMAIATPERPKKSSTSSADTSNPFITTASSRAPSRAPSPVKRAVSGGFQVSRELKRQASNGVIRKGGIESRMQVVKHDYEPPPPAPKPETKRSKSVCSMRDYEGDRFITTTRDMDQLAANLEQMRFEPVSGSPGHTARLAAATGINLNRRILTYHEAPPVATDRMLQKQREVVAPLYARPGALPSSNGAVTNKTRKIPTAPERVLDAPGIVDDFYLNLIAWSAQNVVAVALSENTYIWRADTGAVTHVGEAPEGSYVSSVDFSNDGSYLGVGLGTGSVELWDVETGRRLRSMDGHQAQVAVISWNGHILSSGCADGSIWHHDVRMPTHKVMELHGHTGEVCGLTWRSDGELLASGGNDNVVNIWDGRVGDVAESSRGHAKWTKRNHTAAVKAMAWCPWQPSLLATGGGTNDASINVWNTTTGARLHTLKTPSQVTSIQWCPHKKELMSTHGYPTNSIMIHAYPSLDCVAEIRDAHDSRVLFSALSPAGDVVCTGAGDENLKFWRIWEQPKEKKKKDVKMSSSKLTSSRAGIHTMR
ncbi:WD40 repeat-like protein [Gloeophyllum trabeum ATCC 11539]|uniref:WD40 repeat-like protein n=1 Tax=Gloeophyllum trabeum (strain ATCC 11539 / FP-39264 / Madison 617) TaxID=670483 RepID=S7S1Q0_GLOTA|nr:WD40 repeat-like protein [Gloeophyllum trabeum ATCC 11539]EPQ61380.1 WD40 repeat-like protein [Gloeophyllum trabeum ATCC 11539]